MKIEQQVTSLELSKKLKELGVKQESLFDWIDWYNNEIWQLKESTPRGETVPNDKTEISAYTVAELGELIGSGLNYRINMSGNMVVGHMLYDVGFTDDTEANARAKMLIYLMENDLLE